VPERNAPEDEALGLPRLPPGRHGLAREFVVKNQRDRLTAGIISVVAERGYHEATVTQVCAAAGVSRRTFYSYFSSKEECYLQAFDLIGEHLTLAMEQAGEEEGDWAGRVRARIGAMLGIFAANPDLARFTLVAPLRAGEAVASRHRLALERALEALTADKPKGAQIRTPSPAVEQALVGGMMALIAHKVESGEGEELSELLPDLVELFLTPYLGREQAVRAAGGK
jgi:AcrR family transcriptional regulator